LKLSVKAWAPLIKKIEPVQQKENSFENQNKSI